MRAVLRRTAVVFAAPQGRRRKSRVPGTYMGRRLTASFAVAVVGVALLALAGCAAEKAVIPTDVAKRAASAAPSGVPVTRFVDGDTVKVDLGGQTTTVRFIGIDTPERGQGCYREATDHLHQLVNGHRVTLTAVEGRDDHDRYGRLLRYLAVDGQDLGLAMIQDGWAIARYDGRDGYGQHPRQLEYIAADATSPKRCGR